ncbi:methyltransferase domain-containing protein [Paenibacillus polymyxa]|uniref:methyltransferase domain-containing protein n=1 Tax=Paenibacillus polymyxa TaxID=1406 RepID=UPI0020257F7A|nr:methyltransferase domain-containing protein [Paenibacillus polymyxa]WDZ57575.1 methyltransferase domain-containing protein [Paenibacillus polymyxa]
MSGFEVNSQEYWESRFKTDWDTFSGREQSVFFANIALNLMPDDLIEEIKREKYEICDVGCAEGDGVNVFSKFFDEAQMTGVDFSQEAIAKAKQAYPHIKFNCASIETLTEKFDVIFSSNTLEHFYQPFDMLEKLMEKTKRYVVLLLPFQENPLYPEHFHSFDYNQFPLEYKGFNLIFSKEFDCSYDPRQFWKGKQILIIYAKQSVVNFNKLFLSDYLGTLSTDYTKLKSEISLLNESNSSYKDHNQFLINTNEALNLKYEKLENSFRKDVKTLTDELQLSSQLNKELIELKNDYNLLTNEKTILESKMSEVTLKMTSKIDELGDELKLLKEEYCNNQIYTEEITAKYYEIKGEINHLKHSNFWSIASKYYYLRDNFFPFKVLYKSLKIWKTSGFISLLLALKNKAIRIVKGYDKPVPAPTIKFDKIVEAVLEKKESGDKIAVLPSAFEFDELYNQRTINLAKYLSKNGWIVIFVSWQWSREEQSKQDFKEVINNVFQIPLYSFVENLAHFKLFSKWKEKKYFLTLSPEILVNAIPILRPLGFNIIYDILDEWEEFNKVGQAPWYSKAIEERVIMESDQVIAVSNPLKDKFKDLRSDIQVIGNGYYGDLLGDSQITQTNKQDDIHVGYFGHLTEAWFDWNLIIDSAKRRPDIKFNIIGYGVSNEIKERIQYLDNIFMYGKIHPSELKNYVRKWHIGMIPFINSKLSNAVDPIKVYEYLYFGLPTVCTGIPHLKTYPMVRIAENDSLNFTKNIDILYNDLIENKFNRKNVSQFLEKTTWDARFSEILNTKKNFLTELYNERK